MADEQFAGRGQRTAEWLSKPGENLTLSLFLAPVKLSVDNQFKLTQFSSLVLCQFLESKNISPKIKWPNDIYVGNQKIAGILIENQIGLNEIRNSIIGIGLNVNQTEFNGLNATSLKVLLAKSILLEEVLFEFVATFNGLIEELWENDERLEEMYLEHLLGFNELHDYKDASGNSFTGEIVGTNERGLLRMKIGEVAKEFDLKEIEFIFRNDS